MRGAGLFVLCMGCSGLCFSGVPTHNVRGKVGRILGCDVVCSTQRCWAHCAHFTSSDHWAGKCHTRARHESRKSRSRSRQEGGDVPFAHRIGASRRQTKKVGIARVWDKVESRQTRRGVSARRMRSFRSESRGCGGVGVARQEGGIQRGEGCCWRSNQESVRRSIKMRDADKMMELAGCCVSLLVSPRRRTPRQIALPLRALPRGSAV